MKRNILKAQASWIAYFFIILLFSNSSCQKVIKVDLHNVTPQIVVEGNVSNQTGPYSVKLTKTVNYDQSNVFPAVQGATVTISDNAGNTETLTESAPGIYQTSTLMGVPGRNYILNIKDSGKEYQAISSMPSPLSIDTLFTDSIKFGSNSNIYVNFVLRDPGGVKNYYRAIEIVNGDTLSVINVFDDQYQDGKLLIYPLFSDEKPKVKKGDTVEVILQGIDENMFKYWSELLQVINGGDQSAAPANPTSNISNSALGYFSAHTVTTKKIVIP